MTVFVAQPVRLLSRESSRLFSAARNPISRPDNKRLLSVFIRIPLMLFCLTLAPLHAQPNSQAARNAEARECIQCHSLRLIHSQRLSAAAWGKELDKMINWGAVVKDRKLLLDYLAAEYPDTKPVPEDPKSSDGRRPH